MKVAAALAALSVLIVLPAEAWRQSEIASMSAIGT